MWGFVHRNRNSIIYSSDYVGSRRTPLPPKHQQNQLLRLVDWLQRTIERTISARYREPDIESICRTLAAQTDDPVERAALLEIAGNYRKAPPC